MDRERKAPVSAFEAILPHLGEDRLPKDTVRDATLITAVDRGICALVALGTWLSWSDRKLVPAVTPRLLDAYPAILLWLRFLLSTVPGIACALPRRTPWTVLPVIFGEVHGYFSSWDEQLADCVFSSQSTVNILLEVWSYHPTDAHQGFLAAPTDVTADRMGECLIHPSGKVNFLDAMVQSQNAPVDFCAGLERRITHFESLASNAKPSGTMLALKGILIVALGATGVSIPIRSMMHAHGYIRKIGGLVVELHPRIGATFVFDVWYHLVALAFQHGTAGMGQLLNTGFLPLFVNDMAKATEGNDQSKSLWVIHKLVVMTQTPRFLRALHVSILALPPDMLFADEEAFGGAWRGFVNNLPEAFERLKALERRGLGKRSIRMCDSKMHFKMQELLPEVTGSGPSASIPESKCCSGCHMAVYCSARCQHHDWKERHHRECAAMSQLHLDLKRSGTCYSNKTRDFNIEASRMSVSRKMPNFNAWMHHKFPGKDKRQIIITLSILERPCTLLGGRTYLEELDKHFHGRKKGDCVALEERYASMIQEYTSQVAPPRTWLLDVAIPWGRDSILTQLVELYPAGELDDEGNSVCFVVGHAWRIEPMHEKP
ncbi:hypothetical protein BKA70DRAFT_1560034 [Coprinopsis sp. MPI-PUGE-AT-0042]|nr:hypothetical protein BKA70DRAFT_1560034 [Coprinopsis sp. MPI-PUGE-AT-0042]